MTQFVKQFIEIKSGTDLGMSQLSFGSTHVVAGMLFSCKQNEDRVISEWINDSTFLTFSVQRMFEGK